MKIRPKLEYILKKALDREALSRQEAAWLIKEVGPHLDGSSQSAYPRELR